MLYICRVFQIALRGGGGNFPPLVEESEVLLGANFFTGWWKSEEE